MGGKRVILWSKDQGARQKLKEWANKATATLTEEGDSVRLQDIAAYVQKNAFPNISTGAVQVALQRYVFQPKFKKGYSKGSVEHHALPKALIKHVRVFECPHCGEVSKIEQ